ncbi:hypothetical protein GCM10020255_096000 [Rhodococcus baikonurensis]
MGMTELQVLFRVEIPNALPLILGGLRNATLQVIATATVAAYVNLGGLGRYIFDGLALYKYDRVVVGAILVAVVARRGRPTGAGGLGIGSRHRQAASNTRPRSSVARESHEKAPIGTLCAGSDRGFRSPS